MYETTLKLPILGICSCYQSKEDPILLIYDGHVSYEMGKWGVVLFILPAQSSHLLQQLDGAVFDPIKKHYSECSRNMFNNMGRVITKYEMFALASNAYLKAFNPLNVQSGFRKSGIYPFQKISKGQRLM